MNHKASLANRDCGSIAPAANVLQRACACGSHTVGGGECPECAKGKVSLQSSAINQSDLREVPPIVRETLSSAGEPLDESTRSFFEARLDHDFSNVRVHTDEQAARSSATVNANAYTVGDDVVFGASQYAPRTTVGRRLLAHELTHTLQQRAGVRQSGGISKPGDSDEGHADKIAQSVTETRSGESLPDPQWVARSVTGSAGATIQRQSADHRDAVPPEGRGVIGRPVKPESAGSAVKVGKEKGALPKGHSDATSTGALGTIDRPAQPQSKGPAAKVDSGKDAPTKEPTQKDMPSLFSRFVKYLGELDRMVQGSATQSWGMIIWGEGDGKDGPATKASKDANIWGSFDYSAFMEIMNLVLLAMPESTDYRKKLQSMKEELDARRPEKVAEFLKKVIEETDEYKKLSAEGERQKVGPTGLAKVEHAPVRKSKDAVTSPKSVLKQNVPNDASKSAPTTNKMSAKTQIGQWAANDAFNQYVMIKYSDGTKRFVMGSVFGTRDIEDPGPMEWKQIQGAQVAPKQAVRSDKSKQPATALKTGQQVVSDKSKQTATRKTETQAASQEGSADKAEKQRGATDKTGKSVSTEKSSKPAAAEKSGVSTITAATSALSSTLVDFIADLKKDGTYGSKVRITSTVRSAENDARAVLNNQKSDAAYYKIFSANWEAAILAAIKNRDLKVTSDFDAAVNSLMAWIVEKPERSPHVSGRAVDLGLAGGDKDFKEFVQTAAEDRGIKFIDESHKNHYHLQVNK